MKKSFYVLLSFFLVFSFSGCGKTSIAKSDVSFGNLEYANVNIMGVSYDFYDKGYAYIVGILHENAVFTETVAFNGDNYTVIGIGDCDASAGISGANGVFGSEYSGVKSPENLILPKTIKYIEIGALQYSTAQSITLPDGIESIDTGVFRGCKNLESIEFPKSITNISGLSLFSGCHSLKSVEFPQDCAVFSLSGCFNDCYSLERVVIPDTISAISDSAFCNCLELCNVFLGEGITEIGTWAFSNCPKLETLVIPDSVTIIRERVFHDCPNLKDLTLPDGLADVPANLFIDQYGQPADVSNLTIRVKESMVPYVQSIYPDANVIAK